MPTDPLPPTPRSLDDLEERMLEKYRALSRRVDALADDLARIVRRIKEKRERERERDDAW